MSKNWHPVFLVLLFLGFIWRTIPVESSLIISSGDLQANQNPALFPSQALSLYFPLVRSASLFENDLPIWAHASQPNPHEVVLFRQTFTLTQTLHDVGLYLFADTRYEAWLDGQWVGRGPARFSRNAREYDVYPWEDLSPGEHLIAVLAQWAPNNRRSESVTPLLQGHLRGLNGNGERLIVRTGPQWKAQLSPAWRQDAALVHIWELIGPTELLDLRSLPVDWNQPGFADYDWPQAVVKDPLQVDYRPLQVPRLDIEPFPASVQLDGEATTRAIGERLAEISYRPRSIRPLASLPVTPLFVDAGALSPGRTIIELPPSSGTPSYSLSFVADHPTVFTVETLSSTVVAPPAIQLDELDLSFQLVGNQRPDVVHAASNLSAGPHWMVVSNISSQGTTLSLSTQDVHFSSLPFEQGSHAGRRLLLAEPVSDPQQVIIAGTEFLDVEFISPPAYLVLDLGRTVHGRVIAQVSGPQGAVLDIGWDERLFGETKRPLPFPGSLHYQWNQVDSWILDGQIRSISTIDARAGRYLLIAVWGEGPVQIKKLQVLEERYPLIQRGDFHSSNPLLDRIWLTGVETANLNMTDSYTDTPWRERGQWWGDAYVIDHVNRVAFGEYALLRRGLAAMANAFTPGRAPGAAPNSNHTNMLDYAMLWIHSMAEYARDTEDRSILEETFPVLLQFMDHLKSYENPQNGLLDLPLEHWSNTAYIEVYGYHSRYGQSTALNALYYHTLQEAAWISGRMGDAGRQAIWQRKAEQVKESVNRWLYLPSEGRYLTTLYQGSSIAPSPHAQAWALACGLTPESETGRVAAALLELLSPDPQFPNLDLYGMYWVLEGLGRAGKIPEAIKITENYYGYLLNQGALTWWERLNANLFYGASLSHGWGGAPTWFLSAYVLGLRRSGAYAWQAKPAFQAVDRARGRLPLEYGEVQISWERRSCREIWVELQAPTGSHGEITLPVDNPILEISLNDQTVFQYGQSWVESLSILPGEMRLVLSGGLNTLRILQACPGTIPDDH